MTITFVSHAGGDWEGLYVDGQLVAEGHTLKWWDVLRALSIDYNTINADEEWMYDVGRLPEKLDEVVREVEEQQ